MNKFKLLINKILLESVQQYYLIVDLEGENAKEAVDILKTKGEDAAVEYLKGWDYGGENEHTTYEKPWGRDDHIYKKGEYILAYNLRVNDSVSLYRVAMPTDVKECDMVDQAFNAGTEVPTSGSIETKVDETSTTGGVAGYATPFAFTNNKKGNVDAAKAAKGFTVVEEEKEKAKETETPKDKPVAKKKDEEAGKEDLYLLGKRKSTLKGLGDAKAVGHIARIEKTIKKSLKINEDTDYDVNADYNQFQTGINFQSEKLKNEFERVTKQRLLGKRVIIRASKGAPFPAQPETDHTLEKVENIELEKSKDIYRVVLIDPNSTKFFLNPLFKIKILDGPAQAAAPTAPAKTAEQPAKEPVAQPAKPENPTGGQKTDVSLGKELTKKESVESVVKAKHSISKPVKDSSGDWVVKWMTDGKRDENKTYYTDDLTDATNTAKEMQKHADELNKK